MRVLTVLELLQTHGQLSGAALAARLEVSVRTVQRYVARLQDLGIPVASTRGPGGSYRLRPGFRLPPLMFSTEEALALALGLDALTHLGLGETAPATAGARAKLERVLPEAVSEKVGLLQGVLVSERPPWVVEARTTLLVHLAEAVHARLRTRLLYRARGGAATQRVVEPLGLMQGEGRWFLAGRCLLRNDLRLFRVDRIEAAASLKETFERPEGFEMRTFLQQNLAPSSPWQVEVWLEAPPAALQGRLPRAAVLEAEGGGSLLRCGVADLEEFALLLLYLGCRLEVRGPEALFGAFRRVAERAQGVAHRL